MSDVTLSVESLATIVRALPDADLVRLLTLAARPGEEAPAVAPRAPSAPATPRARVQRGRTTAPPEDVETLVRAVAIACEAAGGPIPRAAILAETSGPDWAAGGWDAARVIGALSAAIDLGKIAMHGQRRGARYAPAG